MNVPAELYIIVIETLWDAHVVRAYGDRDEAVTAAMALDMDAEVQRASMICGRDGQNPMYLWLHRLVNGVPMKSDLLRDLEEEDCQSILDATVNAQAKERAERAQGTLFA